MRYHNRTNGIPFLRIYLSICFRCDTGQGRIKTDCYSASVNQNFPAKRRTIMESVGKLYVPRLTVTLKQEKLCSFRSCGIKHDEESVRIMSLDMIGGFRFIRLSFQTPQCPITRIPLSAPFQSTGCPLLNPLSITLRKCEREKIRRHPDDVCWGMSPHSFGLCLKAIQRLHAKAEAKLPRSREPEELAGMINRLEQQRLG